MPAKFTRTKEDFTCESCGELVRGDGYTNHCPECFHSKHVDINPGDRAEECHGMMKPVAVKWGEPAIIEFRCAKCGAEKANKTSVRDNTDRLIALAKTLADGHARGVG